jgi:hypothetical protein
MTLASIASWQGPDVEPIWTRADGASRAKQRPAKAIGTPDGQQVGTPNAQQSIYLAASSSLIQFNAFVATIQGVLLNFNVDLISKTAAATALTLHVLAAFILCWAARPIWEPPSTVRGRSFVNEHVHVADTFRNYRRGWRMTLLALTASSIAASLFVLNAFGVSVHDLASSLRS